AVDWVDSLGVHAGTTHLAAAGETSLSSLNARLGAMASLAREYAGDHFDFGPNNEVADLQPLQLSSQAAQPAVPVIPTRAPLANAGEALSSALNGNAGDAAFAPEFASDHFDFGHTDASNDVADSHPLQWPNQTIQHAPLDLPTAADGNDLIGGLHDINLGTVVAGGPDAIGNHSLGQFVFNSTFGQTRTSGPEPARSHVEPNQAVFQTVTEILTDAARAMPEATVPIDHTIAVVSGLQHDKPLTDLILHG